MTYSINCPTSKHHRSINLQSLNIIHIRLWEIKSSRNLEEQTRPKTGQSITPHPLSSFSGFCYIFKILFLTREPLLLESLAIDQKPQVYCQHNQTWCGEKDNGANYRVLAKLAAFLIQTTNCFRSLAPPLSSQRLVIPPLCDSKDALSCTI
jgi:hypothetical protein